MRRRCAGVDATSIEAERRVLVSHQGRVSEHPVAPAVESHGDVEELDGIAAGHGDDDGTEQGEDSLPALSFQFQVRGLSATAPGGK